MSAHISQFLPAWLSNGAANVRNFTAPLNRYPARALGRAVTGIVVGTALAEQLLDIPDMPPGNDRLIEIAATAAMTIAALFVLRWFGAGRGILFGLWLTVIGYVWMQGVIGFAYAAWQLIMWAMGVPTDTTEIVVCAAMGAVAFVPTQVALKRLDPDY